ncbi:hypothetical protein ACQY0O_001320 [Thecaphora frezii]
MRPTTSLLLLVKPLPATAFASLRLPPVATRRASQSGTQPLSKQTKSRLQHKPQQTVVQSLAHKAVDAAARSDAQWPSNLRIEEHINKKNLYWKVSKPQRDILIKTLREA